MKEISNTSISISISTININIQSVPQQFTPTTGMQVKHQLQLIPKPVVTRHLHAYLQQRKLLLIQYHERQSAVSHVPRSLMSGPSSHMTNHQKPITN